MADKHRNRRMRRWNRGAETAMRYLFTVILALLISVPAFGAEYTADTCSASDVQDAIDSASNGDTVDIPAGECTWSSQVSIASLSASVMGAGATTTIITMGISSALDISGSTSDELRISGIRFEGGSRSPAIHVGGTHQQFRFDHNIINEGYRMFEIQGTVYGVMDHNTFQNSTGSSMLTVTGPTGWSSNIALYETEDARGFGTQYALFVEDNDFISTVLRNDAYHTMTSNRGVSVVYRYNTVYTTTAGDMWDVVDAHGYCSQPAAGTAKYEYYNNTITTGGGGYISTMFRVRGGKGLIYDNTFTGSQSSSATDHDIEVTNYRSRNYTTSIVPSCYDGDPSGDRPPMEARCETEEGYPCQDQINNLYIWDNTFNGGAANVYVDGGNDVPTHVQEDRDYFLTEYSYTPYTYPHPLVSEEAPPSTPLSIGITTPTSSPTYETETTPIPVGGISDYASALSSVTWANSEASTAGTATGTTTWSASIDLVAGTNTITATVNAADSSTETDSIVITYSEPASPPASPTITSIGTGSGTWSGQ